jgi:hypothetical protein
LVDDEGGGIEIRTADLQATRGQEAADETDDSGIEGLHPIRRCDPEPLDDE